VQTVPFCEIPIVWPPTVSSVERAVGDDPFEAMVTMTVPLPVPPCGTTAAHESALDAAHEQLLPFAVIPMFPTPPAGPYGLPSPEVSTVMLQASASCEIEKSWPPIASEPDRANVVGLGATEYTSVADPLPEPPEVTEIQLGPSTVP
jgi:hypothetical protein